MIWYVIEDTPLDSKKASGLLQGDRAACAKPSIDFKSKVPLWPSQARTGQTSWIQREVLHKLLCRPLYYMIHYKLVFDWEGPWVHHIHAKDFSRKRCPRCWKDFRYALTIVAVVFIEGESVCRWDHFPSIARPPCLCPASTWDPAVSPMGPGREVRKLKRRVDRADSD